MSPISGSLAQKQTGLAAGGQVHRQVHAIAPIPLPGYACALDA